MRVRSVAISGLVGVALLAALSSGEAMRSGAVAGGESASGTSAQVPELDHIFTIVLSSQGRDRILGDLVNAPFLNRLAAERGVAVSYGAVARPGLPNRLALVGGSTFGVTEDCTPAECGVNAPNLPVNRVSASGRTWRGYFEDLPGPCARGDSFPYREVTNPFVYFQNIREDPAQCANVVPYGALAADLTSVETTPSYAWISPNALHDMSSDSSVAAGDLWLSQQVPVILSSAAFAAGHSLLVITWDQADPLSGGDNVATLLLDSGAKGQVRSADPYDHYSLLSTIEASWGLGPLTAQDASAPPLADLFPGSQTAPTTTSTSTSTSTTSGTSTSTTSTSTTPTSSTSVPPPSSSTTSVPPTSVPPTSGSTTSTTSRPPVSSTSTTQPPPIPTTTSTTVRPPAPPPGVPPSARQLLGNPGFENGPSNPGPWVATTYVILGAASGEAPRNGAWSAWLDGYGSARTDTISQSVTIPPATTQAMVEVWVRVSTGEIDRAVHDTLKVELVDERGAALALLRTYSNLDASRGFVQGVFDVSAFRGRTVTLRLTGTEDGARFTSFVLDDLGLWVAP